MHPSRNCTYTRLLLRSQPLSLSRCFALLWPPSPQQFVAIENIYYTSSFKAFDVIADAVPFATLQQKAATYCSTPFASLRSEYPEEKVENLAKYCFSAAFINTIVTFGLGLSQPDRDVRIVNKIHDVSLDWSLGAAIFQVTSELTPKTNTVTNASIPQDVDGKHIQTSSLPTFNETLVPLLLLVCLSGVALLALRVYRHRMRSKLTIADLGRMV